MQLKIVKPQSLLTEGARPAAHQAVEAGATLVPFLCYNGGPRRGERGCRTAASLEQDA
jgi:hypothetical protein